MSSGSSGMMMDREGGANDAMLKQQKMKEYFTSSEGNNKVKCEFYYILHIIYYILYIVFIFL